MSNHFPCRTPSAIGVLRGPGSRTQKSYVVNRRCCVLADDLGAIVSCFCVPFSLVFPRKEAERREKGGKGKKGKKTKEKCKSAKRGKKGKKREKGKKGKKGKKKGKKREQKGNKGQKGKKK